MGQQQLLLIVLGVIVVGIAIVVGINLFNANSIASNRDAVISDLNNLGSMALSYYKKPTAMGGGNNTFTGWDITQTGFEVDGAAVKTANGSYTATVAAQTLTIVGTGTELADGTNKVKATATVTSAGITVAVDN